MVRSTFDREPTRPFPEDKARSGWVRRERVVPRSTEGGRWVEWEDEEYEDLDTLTRGERPFLIWNHKAQLREDHQRIVRGPNGGFMHVDAGEVMDVEAFMASDRRAYFLEEVRRGVWQWRRRDGNGSFDNGFVFPGAQWAGGQDEELDPQWVRETYKVSIAEQVDECRRRRLDRCEARRESGDKRGTTLNLQIGASADDAYENRSTGAVNLTDNQNIFGSIGSLADPGLRFTGVSGLSGANIDAATLTFRATATDSGSFVGDWFAEDAASPSAFAATNFNLSGRSVTTATCEGDSSDFGNWTDGNDHQFTGDGTNTIADILQELADSYDPSEIVLLHRYTSGDGERLLRSYDGDSALAPKLDIDYTAAAGGGFTPRLTLLGVG